jgi:uncharacterized phage infection (PIP) family protein YhgE
MSISWNRLLIFFFLRTWVWSFCSEKISVSSSSVTSLVWLEGEYELSTLYCYNLTSILSFLSNFDFICSYLSSFSRFKVAWLFSMYSLICRNTSSSTSLKLYLSPVIFGFLTGFFLPTYSNCCVPNYFVRESLKSFFPSSIL